MTDCTRTTPGRLPRLMLLSLAAVAVMLLFGGPPLSAQAPPPGEPRQLTMEELEISVQALRLQTNGILAARDGRIEESLAALNEALRLFRQIGDRRNEGRTLDSIGQTYRRTSDYDEAVRHFEQALAIAGEVGDRTGEASANVSLGNLASNLGQYTRALAYNERALALVEGLFQEALANGDPNAIALEGLRALVVSNNLGFVTASLGRFADALSYYNDALIVARFLEDSESVGTVLNNIGDLYHDVGQLERALDYYQQALTIARGMGDQDSEVIYLSNVGSALHSLRDYEGALTLHREALTLARELGYRNGERSALNNIGASLGELGRYAEALAAYQESLASARQLRDREGEGTVLGNIAYLFIVQGQYREALPLLNDTLAIARENGTLLAEETALGNLAFAQEGLGELEAALGTYLAAIAVSEDVRAAARVDELKTSLFETRTMLYARAALLLEQLGRPREAFDLAERGRARTFLDQLGNVRLEPGARGNPQLLARERELRAEISTLDSELRTERAVEARGARGSTRAAVLSRELDSRQQEYSDLVIRLKAADPEAASLVSVAPLSLAEVQRELDADTTLLSYYVTPEFTGALQVGGPPATTFAFIITRDSFAVVDLGVTRSELQPVVQAFREFRDLSDANPAELARLSAWLVDPVREQVRTPVVGIIPSDVLHYLPFAALRDGDAYLGDVRTLFYLPSASTLPYIAAKRKAQTGGVLAIGQGQAVGLPPLRFAEGEAQSVADLYGARALTGDAATEAAFRSAAAGAGIIHLAAHGELNPTAPLFSRVFLAPEGEGDGSLTVQEVYSLNLQRADLVVLSACETVLGAQSRGDDIVGLNRAFIYAGAPTVVASLWSVNDLATSVLMTAFYRSLQAGLSKAEALQAAQQETRAIPAFSHPFYWAAFVLTGDAGPSAVR